MARSKLAIARVRSLAAAAAKPYSNFSRLLIADCDIQQAFETTRSLAWGSRSLRIGYPIDDN